MNKSVQILILLALFPTLGMAREETLEERKQRIVRKYLRESMTLEQSGMIVPSDLPEDERVTDSEKFKDAEISLQREDGSPTAAVLPPRPPRPVARRANSNWLLDTDEGTTDAYGNPVTASTIDSGDDLWSAWDGSSEKKATSEIDRQDRRSYDPSRNSPYSRQNAERGTADAQNAQNALYGNQPNSRYGRTEDANRTDLFGRTRSDYSSGLNVQGTGSNPYGSDPEQGMLTSPFPQLNSSGQERSSLEQERRQSYKPYQSSYDKQREERSQQQQYTQPQQQQEFKRPDSYQQWKERNKTWDPTADDAYLNETMQKNKR